MSKYFDPKLKEIDVVYHCIPVAPTGTCIFPSDRYGTNIPPDVRRQLGMPEEGNTPLVFTSRYMTKAMAFGLSGGLNEKILNSSIDGSPNELVLACDRLSLMSRERDVTVYEISARGFVNLHNADRQCVSTNAVPFDETRVALHAKNAVDLMKRGLQILAFNETFSELQGYDFVQKEMRARKQTDLYQFMGDMIREGKLIWENKERDINPDPTLAKKMNIEISAGIKNPSKNKQAPKPI